MTPFCFKKKNSFIQKGKKFLAQNTPSKKFQQNLVPNKPPFRALHALVPTNP
jgi:hypothetical protein